ncbi:hypothetical protein P0O24_03840 [Methanotrichaceae archaeon M04Ac]|uniref:Uncharacterized protein n=1 Tax=Candidatus Methanocrinis alkalitolerans TaxID=3033395 RepID=A0ABT5XDC4_9EURY|nr:hypothetical protein [Candidatus Methanocrinis alkalitolerans]MCR3884346.1 hypothetical protein [Methanothrix sp.]MDF0592710.1 hypothetical protein [Candidatus Methanocrinis alkalitolerans]
MDTAEPSLENSMDGDGALKTVGGNGLLKEVEALRRLHGDAICDAEKCREFNRRMSQLLMDLEDTEEFRLADRVMDALAVCSPKTGSHCDNSERMKGILERLAERVKERTEEMAGGGGP